MPRTFALMLCCAVGALLAACAKKTEAPAPLAEDTRCEAIFVLAPACYTLFTSADLLPLLASEGREQDMPVFCTAEEARSAIAAREEAGDLPVGLWQVFRLDGQWENEVVQLEPGTHRMRHPATLSYHPGDNPVGDRI